MDNARHFDAICKCAIEIVRLSRPVFVEDRADLGLGCYLAAIEFIQSLAHEGAFFVAQAIHFIARIDDLLEDLSSVFLAFFGKRFQFFRSRVPAP